MADERYNMRNPAVKRILQEVREMQNNGSDEFMSLPMQENIFEWQFAIRGPEETEFESGIYHGRIQLPPEYPFRPPAFMLLTPNGRFETQTKICLSISQHHPEHWQPSWSVRTALVALIAFLPTKPDGALGSLDYTKEERRSLAVKSRSAPPKFGNADRQQLIDEIHEYMLKKTPAARTPAPALAPVMETLRKPAVAEAEAAAPAREDSAAEGVREPAESNSQAPQAEANSAGFRAPNGVAQMEQARARGGRAGATLPATTENRGLVARLGLAEDMGLTILAIGLTVLIIAILVKKVLTISVLPPTEIDS